MDASWSRVGVGGRAMTAFLEVMRPSGVEVVELGRDRHTIGRETTCDVVLVEDAEVSRRHAVLERRDAHWSIRDLGSRNGTRVAGRRVAGECVLHDGDDILLGSSRLRFRVARSGSVMPGARDTAVAVTPPEITPRERDLLVALCRPLRGGAPFCEPAAIGEIAAALGIGVSEVEHHLGRLYEKFGVDDRSGRGRIHLANQAILRGAVRPGPLR